jgi:serine/threonine protein kinase
LGKIEAHPENVDGLVMALIEHGFANLAGPPSLETCTRDVYHEHACFTLSAALRLAYGIASAACHLHARGIVHGDLYAHNILHAADGEALLGDFGAASFFNHEDQVQAEALQRIEVRAFGCLLEELLERVNITVDEENALKILADLQADCVQENISARPLFAEIVQRLQQINMG